MRGRLLGGLVLVALLLPQDSNRGARKLRLIDWRHGAHRIFKTQFHLVENPISENGSWRNGKKDGFDWTDVRTIPGLAFGTQTPPTGPPYNDSIAVLTGDWNPNQAATAMVHTVAQSGYEEVELLLRMSITPHFTTGYEVNFRCDRGHWSYVQFGYWQGPLNQFGPPLAATTGPGLWDGDVVGASIVGNRITVWVNGRTVLEGTDPKNRYISGNPGIGFYFQDSNGKNSDYGFTSFAASDENG